MLDIADGLLASLPSGDAVVVTVTRVARSAPRGVGASMAVTATRELIGSISGGCVESDAIALAHEVRSDGRARTARFGFSDEQAYAAGLACGGTVEVIAYLVRTTDAVALRALRSAVHDERVSVLLPLTGPSAGRILDTAAPLASAAVHAELDAARLLGETRCIDADGDALLVLCHAPRARLIIAGAGEHAAALCRIGAAAGFAVTVCDPWELLVTPERFPGAADLVVADPAEYLRAQAAEPGSTDMRTAVCVLTHDERLDVPAIHAALGMNAGFVGAMGARSTVARRRELLSERGVGLDDLARIHSPLGLDLGGSSPQEAAIAALAEIQAVRHGATARPLHELSGPIHSHAPDAAGDRATLPHCVS